MSSLGSALGSEKVIPPVPFQDMASFRYTKSGGFRQDRFGQGGTRCEIDLVDPRLDSWIAVDWWSREIEAGHGLVDSSIVIEQ
jgi:hypothetical protein